MASIMCGQKLWRNLFDPNRTRAKRSSAVPEQPIFQNVIFGPWAATLARFDDRDIVIALDVAARLTVAFRFYTRERFHRDFAEAVSYALEDLRVPPRTVACEASVIEATPLARLTDRPLLDDLEYTKAICDIELAYSTDMRRVQLRLNDLPHGGIELCVPSEAVTALVNLATAEYDTRAH